DRRREADVPPFLHSVRTGQPDRAVRRRPQRLLRAVVGWIGFTEIGGSKRSPELSMEARFDSPPLRFAAIGDSASGSPNAGAWLLRRRRPRWECGRLARTTPRVIPTERSDCGNPLTADTVTRRFFF